jgi:hypothetical protein
VNANVLRRAVAVACDLTAGVAAGLAQTVIAASSTLAAAVTPVEPEPERLPWIPPAPPPLPPLPPLLAEAVDRLNGDWSEWIPRRSFSPWLSDDLTVPDDASELGGPDWPGMLS